MNHVQSLSVLILLTASAIAETPGILSPRLIIPGAVLLHEDFTTPELSVSWKKTQGIWTVNQQAAVGQKDPASKHPAKLLLNRPLADGALSFTFQINVPGGLDLDLYDGERRVANLRLRAGAFSFGTYPQIGPSEVTLLAQTASGFTPGRPHTILFERKGDTILIQSSNGLKLGCQAPALPSPLTSTLYVLRGPPETTVHISNVQMTAVK